jgi:RNA polymerase sigma factor (sigma-70 family)
LTGAGDPDAHDVALAVRGDTRAFERVYRRHGAGLHALARRMVGPELADDGVQDVFLHAWKQLGQFRGEARFSTWLHRVAVSVLLRQATNARRIAARVSSSDPDSLQARVSPTDAHIDVNSALSRLTEEVRAVVVLHDMEGYGHAEIADALGISVSASKMRLLRARMQLREWLVP